MSDACRCFAAHRRRFPLMLFSRRLFDYLHITPSGVLLSPYLYCYYIMLMLLLPPPPDVTASA